MELAGSEYASCSQWQSQSQPRTIVCTSMALADSEPLFIVFLLRVFFVSTTAGTDCFEAIAEDRACVLHVLAAV